MQQAFDKATVCRIAGAWLRGSWLTERIDQRRPSRPRFTDEEADDFGRYLWHALQTAPTHAIPKMPYNLILHLGIGHDGLNPGAEVEVAPHRFGHQLVKWKCNRKFGPSVLFALVADAIARVPELGRVDYILHDAAHFGYGRLYGEMLADAGLISTICNTAGRGNEVFPLGANTKDASCARMGTNPITFTMPLGPAGSAHFSLDAATTTVSFGTMTFRRLTGELLPQGCAVDAEGEPTNDPQQAARLVHNDRLGYGLGLWIEALAAVIGGGLPEQRCMRVGDRIGGSSDCLVTVVHPDYLSVAAGDAIERAGERLRHIVDSNGTARVPGMGRPRQEESASATVTLHGKVREGLLQMASEAGIEA